MSRLLFFQFDAMPLVWPSNVDVQSVSGINFSWQDVSSTQTMADDFDQQPPLTINRGATKSFRFTALGPSGALGLTNALAWFSIKGRFEDAISLVAKRSQSAGGPVNQIQFLTQAGATLGKWEALLVPTDTANLLPGRYVCDAWVQLATGELYLCAKRYFDVFGVVTTKFPIK